MKRLLTAFIAGLLAMFQASAILAQPATPAAPDRTSNEQSEPSSPEITAIRAAAEAFVTAFNQADAAAVAALWTEDGEYIDEGGRRFTGRDAIEKEYATFFADNPNTKIRISVDSVRLLSEGTAIEDGRAAIDSPAGTATGFTSYTAVHVKVAGQWKMASVRDAFIAAPAAVTSAADLDFLVGTWVAEEHGEKTVSVVEWVVDGCFLQRSYTLTRLDGSTSSGIQLLGWNAAGGHVQSWNFSPDGGHAVGIWIPDQGGWLGQMRGTTGDGVPTTCINHLRKLDDNAYVWQSVHRCVGGVTLPDTGEVVWKRQSTSR